MEPRVATRVLPVRALDRTLTIRLARSDLTKLDQIRGARSPSAMVRDLIRSATRDSAPPTHEQALLVLREHTSFELLAPMW